MLIFENQAKQTHPSLHWKSGCLFIKSEAKQKNKIKWIWWTNYKWTYSTQEYIQARDNC